MLTWLHYLNYVHHPINCCLVWIKWCGLIRNRCGTIIGIQIITTKASVLPFDHHTCVSVSFDHETCVVSERMFWEIVPGKAETMEMQFESRNEKYASKLQAVSCLVCHLIIKHVSPVTECSEVVSSESRIRQMQLESRNERLAPPFFSLCPASIEPVLWCNFMHGKNQLSRRCIFLLDSCRAVIRERGGSNVQLNREHSVSSFSRKSQI